MAIIFSKTNPRELPSDIKQRIDDLNSLRIKLDLASSISDDHDLYAQKGADPSDAMLYTATWSDQYDFFLRLVDLWKDGNDFRLELDERHVLSGLDDGELDPDDPDVIEDLNRAVDLEYLGMWVGEFEYWFDEAKRSFTDIGYCWVQSLTIQQTSHPAI